MMRIGWIWLGLWVFSGESSLACNPNFCDGKNHGSHHCDPADNTSYYICDNGDSKHFTCGADMIYDGSICNWPSAGACITNPVPDSNPGTVVNGVCVASGSAGSSSDSGTADKGVPVLRNVYVRHPNVQSACVEEKTVTVSVVRDCASLCHHSGVCTDFNFFTTLTAAASYDCQLLVCSTDFFMSLATHADFYQQI